MYSERFGGLFGEFVKENWKSDIADKMEYWICQCSEEDMKKLAYDAYTILFCPTLKKLSTIRTIRYVDTMPDDDDENFLCSFYFYGDSHSYILKVKTGSINLKVFSRNEEKIERYGFPEVLINIPYEKEKIKDLSEFCPILYRILQWKNFENC